ncbi:hypothetical protein [Mammaliicoccus sciuri]|uniref:hypothetical protein n=1 Tax=Mammaliicoccus sciuri TaxID=1296 RepID=UPI0021CFD9B2|nr:hypothetical protein [Mammaliicoccus sciuri]UXV30026.1 hypothetical protein MUA76_03180 [Mammaliicoccus sciuri]UXV31885.1 hypothetical protein MUA60_13225 [Mammaliicoccus sciuri]
MVDQAHVQEFKARNRIFYDMEDERIKSDLEYSYEDIKAKCGEFSMKDSAIGRELVYERTRYVLNDMLEAFHNNFLSNIIQFQLMNMEVVEDETK